MRERQAARNGGGTLLDLYRLESRKSGREERLFPTFGWVHFESWGGQRLDSDTGWVCIYPGYVGMWCVPVKWMRAGTYGCCFLLRCEPAAGAGCFRCYRTTAWVQYYALGQSAQAEQRSPKFVQPWASLRLSTYTSCPAKSGSKFVGCRKGCRTPVMHTRTHTIQEKIQGGKRSTRNTE